MLEAGRDLSPLVPQMYDISGWSHRLLWGASVDIVRDGPLRTFSLPVSVASPTGGVSARPGEDLLLNVADGKDAQALNALLDAGVTVRWAAAGAAVVPASARRLAATVADRYGVRFVGAPSGAGGPVLRRPVLAAAVSADELFVLRDLGYDVRPVSTAVLNAGFDWSGVSTLVVSSGLVYTSLDADARTALDAFLARGAVVTRGVTGARFNTAANLLPVTGVAGRADANGVMSVTNGSGPVAAGALPHAFIYSPVWFTAIGAGVTVEQRYGSLVAGHWLSDDDGTGGADQGAGQASVVSGVAARGTATVLFGTEPMFRAHPKGMYGQVARAIYWSTSTVSAAVPTA
jgi:hypothetical protein